MEEECTIYSIGHGRKTIEQFISEINIYKIKYVIDVRSIPFSKWAQQFNKAVIGSWLNNFGVIYTYMGDSLGGKPKDNSCCDKDGYIDYRKMADIPKFKEGMKHLISANDGKFRVSIMCSESDPSLCHRSKLIGRELYFNNNININHITGIGKCISQTEIMKYLNKIQYGYSSDLFGSCDNTYFKSCKPYKK